MTQSFEKYKGKTVLVTGATGFTGRAVTKKLVEAGADVRAIARISSKLGDLEPLTIQWFRGDVFDAELIKKACDGVHYIFHLAAAFREVKADDEGYARVHVESTQLLAKEVVGRSDFECFVHVSTVGVHGHIEIDRADEEYRFAPGDGYQRTKLDGELWIRKFAAENNLPFAVIRPGPIFGPGDMRLLKLFRMVRKGYLLILGKGKCIYHLVHVDDLSNIILLAGITPEARSEVMIAACDDPIPLEEMAKHIADSIGIKRAKTIRLPLFPFYIASDICKLICTPLGLNPPIYRRRVDFYTKDRKFDNSKVKRLLNYTIKYDNPAGIKDTAQWYLENNLLD
ncbi:MAG: NAD-dependent epimerase/dehydratase family protein [Arenicella sp.]